MPLPGSHDLTATLQAQLSFSADAELGARAY